MIVQRFWSRREPVFENRQAVPQTGIAAFSCVIDLQSVWIRLPLT